MSTATAETTSETAAETAAPTTVLIHTRFAPDGTVTEIGERPASLTAQEWFNYLSQNTQNTYQALSGGRGVFRLPGAEVDRLKAAAVG